MSQTYEETVLSVHHWTDRTFSFTCTRNAGFRFDNGQFTMIGLEVDGKPLLRAYSMVSPNYFETLEWLSIKVPDGPLTSRLQHIQVGDTVLIGKKPVGTLVVDNLTPGRNLYLFGTGTGLAPFMSIIRDPETYERYEKVVLVHGCRIIAELAYRDYILGELRDDEYLGELVREKLIYHPTVTREAFFNTGRIPEIIADGSLFAKQELPTLDPAVDRAMLCGSPEFNTDMRPLLEGLGLSEGASNKPGEYLVERAFVER
jgi:ferredoxin--NADP+ reductase